LIKKLGNDREKALLWSGKIGVGKINICSDRILPSHRNIPVWSPYLEEIKGKRHVHNSTNIYCRKLKIKIYENHRMNYFDKI